MCKPVLVGSVGVACQDGECPEVVDVSVFAAFRADDAGRQSLVTWPELADLWAHAWTHEQD